MEAKLTRLPIPPDPDVPRCPDCGARLVYMQVPGAQDKGGGPMFAWRCSWCRCWWTEEDLEKEAHDGNDV